MNFLLLVFTFTLISFDKSSAIEQSNDKDLLTKLFGTREVIVKSRAFELSHDKHIITRLFIQANRKNRMPNMSKRQFQFKPINSSRVARGPKKFKTLTHNEVFTKHNCQLIMQLLKKNKKHHERPESVLQGVWGVPG